MKNFFKARFAPLFGIIALVAVMVFSMAACDSGGGGGGGSGSISGVWEELSLFPGDPPASTITFSGSNYECVKADGTEISKGTYTLASDGKDITYKQTSPSSATYNGYYEPTLLTANFTGYNVQYKKKE